MGLVRGFQGIEFRGYLGFLDELGLGGIWDIFGKIQGHLALVLFKAEFRGFCGPFQGLFELLGLLGYV